MRDMIERTKDHSFRDRIQGKLNQIIETARSFDWMLDCAGKSGVKKARLERLAREINDILEECD